MPSTNTIPSILFVAANPTDAARLQSEQELQAISDRLERSPYRKQLHLEPRLVARPRDIQRAMLDVEPKIVHFTGKLIGGQGLLFEDESGLLQPIAEKALGSLFILFAEQVQCVILSGCYSQIQGQAIAQHIPHVIGINQEIGEQAAIEFAVSFYDAIGSGRSVEFAYKLASSALQLDGVAEPLIPTLLNRTSNKTTPPPLEPVPPPAATPGNLFNIAGGTITNLTGAGAIHHQQTVVQQQDSTEPQPSFMPADPIASPMPATDPKVILDGKNIEVFFSYSHRDEDLRDEMAKQLSMLKRQRVITEWYDRDIEAGTEWAEAIDEHLNTAQLILLLISPDFIASDYCFDIEMKRAMERHHAGEARVIPVILRPVDWHSAPFGKVQALPIVRGGGAKAVTTWANRDEAFLNVAQGIRKAVERMVAK